MAKRLSEKDKKEISRLFIDGTNVDQIAKIFNCTKLTISRNLKKFIGEEKFKLLKKNTKSLLEDEVIDNDERSNQINKNSFVKENTENVEQEFSPLASFVEITPLDYQIENTSQKDLSSIPLSEVEFPKIVYMIVDNKIELEIKHLKDFPDWQFLSKDELNRQTIEIYEDLKNAKRFCKKEQKVIKVPNTNIFKIVAPILLSRGISRIINNDKLIAL